MHRGPRGTAAFRTYRDQIEGRVRLALKRPADRVVQRLLIRNVGPIEADDDERAVARLGSRRLGRRAGQGDDADANQAGTQLIQGRADGVMMLLLNDDTEQ